MPISCSPEHKIAIFVRFCPSEPLFSGLSSTKRAFLCQKGQLFPGFTPFRAQNRGFCAWVAVIAETLTLSPASGRAIKKRVTSKSPNGLFSYPLLWIGICSGALESINSAKLEIAPVYVVNYSVLVLNGETPVIVEHILETGSKIKGKSTLCILASRRV